MSSYLEDLRKARRVGAPIVAIEATNTLATVKDVIKNVFDDAPKVWADEPERKRPILLWDMVRGANPYGITQTHLEQSREAMPDGTTPETFQSPAGLVSLLNEAAKGNVSEGTVIIAINAGMPLSSTPPNMGIIQAIANCRDTFKASKPPMQLVIVGPPFNLPTELRYDVLVLEAGLPSRDELETLTRDIYRYAGLEADEEIIPQCVDRLTGLSSFAAEQALAMSLTRDGMDLEQLWERKRQNIESTPGLSVYQGGETFDDIEGVSNIKNYVERIVEGRFKPGAIVFIDEIEKHLGGIAGDNTGISQDFLGQLLQFMQNNQSRGMIFIGPPGTSKSLVSKAIGTAAGVPTIEFDIGGMKQSLAGESEQNMRASLDVVNSISNGRALFIATCNKIADLPPELRRRFSLGTFFFDLPDADERKAIWALYMRRYELEGPTPDDIGWTGAEIATCCRTAYDLGMTLEQAATYIVPVAISSASSIERLRNEASGRYISANHTGTYQYKPVEGLKDTNESSRMIEI